MQFCVNPKRLIAEYRQQQQSDDRDLAAHERPSLSRSNKLHHQRGSPRKSLLKRRKRCMFSTTTLVVLMIMMMVTMRVRNGLNPSAYVHKSAIAFYHRENCVRVSLPSDAGPQFSSSSVLLSDMVVLYTCSFLKQRAVTLPIINATLNYMAGMKLCGYTGTYEHNLIGQLKILSPSQLYRVIASISLGYQIVIKSYNVHF